MEWHANNTELKDTNALKREGKLFMLKNAKRMCMAVDSVQKQSSNLSMVAWQRS